MPSNHVKFNQSALGLVRISKTGFVRVRVKVKVKVKVRLNFNHISQHIVNAKFQISLWA